MDTQHIDWIVVGDWIATGLKAGLLLAFMFVVGSWLGGRLYVLMAWFNRNADARAREERRQDACLTRMDHHLARLEMDRVVPGADVAILKLDLGMLKESIWEGRASSR